MMDPYADGKPLGTNPRLMLQLGNVSEDVLKDGNFNTKMVYLPLMYLPKHLQLI
jgi:hypothetical protein